LFAKLQERKNVEIHTNMEITTLDMNKDIRGNVKQITTGKGSKVKIFDVDSLVLCNGW
jgi:2-polyprenyl-6-methoxyphenol hydroxylase-like FAD-dependent oxidoreductase